MANVSFEIVDNNMLGLLENKDNNQASAENEFTINEELLREDKLKI